MSYRYNNLSSGYTGKHCENATLNSKFYSHFFDDINRNSELTNHLIAFPQRVPRKLFFVELYELETNSYRKDFDLIINELKNSHLRSLKNIAKNTREFINWSYLLMRYCQFEHLVTYSPTNYSAQFALEVIMLREAAKIEMLLSEDKMVSIDEQLELADIFLENKETSEREKIILLNQIIVNFYRHQENKSIAKKVNQLSTYLLELIEKYESNHFINMLHCSVAYRGLAMVNTFEAEQQYLFLNKAEKIARDMPYNTAIEKAVAGDNLFTCIQSLSKWHLHQKNLIKSEHYLHELTSIDPNDSTGYSELGFFYLNQSNYEKASNCFIKAMQLGPPGAGMNAYYYAKCLEMLGNAQDAIKYLYESTELDAQGISAWLDLLSYFTQQKQNDKTSEIARHIYDSSILFEQLEDEEKIYIQTFIN